MSKMCQICGGLVAMPGEALGYTGSMCSGYHPGYMPSSVPVVYVPNPNIEAKLDKIIELLTPKESEARR